MAAMGNVEMLDTMESSDDDDNSVTKCEKSKKLNTKSTKNEKPKKFKEYWLENPLFKNWLERGKTSMQAKCKICVATIQAGKSELLKHLRTKKHTQNMKACQTSHDIRNIFENNVETQHKKKVKVAEMKLAAFFAAKNIAFHIIDDLEPLLKDIFQDSRICQDLGQDISIKRTKCTEIIKNVLCKKQTNDLVEHLRENNFSVLVDESTDLSDTKTLAILTRYIRNDRVETHLLKLIELDGQKLGATELFAAIETCFRNFEIPLENIVGFASDGASVMVGRHHSVFKLLHDQVNHVILIKCICHSAALVAAKATSSLPNTLEELVRSIYRYISGSKRVSQLREMQEFFDVPQHRILKLSQTRWLSWHECIVRIVKNWTVLEHYFIMAVSEDPSNCSNFVLNELRNMTTKAYLLFLKYTLNIFNKFNALFQSKKPLIQVLYTECMLLLQQVCKNYLDQAVIFNNDLAEIDLTYPRYFLPIEKMYLGPECEALLPKLEAGDRHTFLLNCQMFYIRAASELQQRLPSRIFKDMSFLSNPFSSQEDVRRWNFNNLCDKFPQLQIDKTEIAIEWRNMPDLFSREKIAEFESKPLDEMWMDIVRTKTFDNYLAFPNLKKLVCIILMQPHSNAETERIFSIVTDTKTKKRNRLAEASLNAVCVFRSYLQTCGHNVAKFEITDDHLKLFNKNMYTFKNNDK